ncbi:hypothetical protein HMPREF1531_01587 [Propionibacterium sp. oral taxon 192 str. F0372]|nr:hypothetical protein HMPREF1531_01587 [Propionibacterium sp. oral taxon 192 str. F0372]
MLLVLGLIVLVAFIGIMVYNVIEVNQLHAVAIANRSAGFDNPRNMMLIGSGLGLAAGLLLGLGIATPSRGFKARYADARKAEAISDAEAQGFHGASVPESSVIQPNPEPPTPTA